MSTPAFSDACRAAIESKGAAEAIYALARLIRHASMDAEFGEGPPLDELNKARRAYLALIDIHYGGALERAERPEQ